MAGPTIDQRIEWDFRKGQEGIFHDDLLVTGMAYRRPEVMLCS